MMILGYLLWIPTLPFSILCWLFQLEDDRFFRLPLPLSSWRAPAQDHETPLRDRLKMPHNGEEPTEPLPQGSEYQVQQDDRPYSAASDCLTRVLEIIPDVKPDHITRLIDIALPKYDQYEVLERVLHTLLETSSYPKVNSSENAKHADLVKAGGSPKAKFDFGYGNKSRPFTGGADYTELALVRRLL